jgi:hypothetical protein
MPTPNLGLPYIVQGQAQKEVTHNEALNLLDAVVQLAVLDRDLAAPPGSPAQGARYLVAASPTGAWAGHADHIAVFLDGGWLFFAPGTGWLAWVVDEAAFLRWSGTAWVNFMNLAAIQNLAMLGILTTADATNRLAIKSNAVLLSHDDVTPGTGDMRATINKSAAAKDAGFTFQDNFSTRALFGLLGDDDFHLKVSPDGSDFYDALQIDRTSGEINLGQRRLQAAIAAHGGKTELFCDEELITLSGVTTNSTVPIPNGAIVLAVSNRVVTAITGATSYSCGVSGEAGKFGSGLGVSAGSTNRGAIGPTAFYADTPVLYTAAGGNFTGGQVRMTIHYLKPTWATS